MTPERSYDRAVVRRRPGISLLLGLAAAVLRLLDDPERARALAAVARQLREDQ